ncbi:MAG TPA: hypothetical protein VLQ91_19475 [Draconibacterium sp.]|nr:hypothetical protein [Draconibacterium sp.]
MIVQKVIPIDPKKENEKYLIFVDYILVKLKNGRPAGISIRNLASDYKTEMGTTFDSQELKEFIQLYDGLYFNKFKSSIDRLNIKNNTVRILSEYGSIGEYLKQHGNNVNKGQIFTINKGKIKNLKSWIVGSVLFLAAATTLMLNAMEIIQIFPQKDNSINQIQFGDQKGKDQQTKENVELHGDSLNILETDSLSNKLK